VSHPFHKYNNPEVQLNPSGHPQAARHFLAHFGLVSRSPDRAFLERILDAFARIPYENISKILKLNHHFTTPEHLRLPEEVVEEHIRHNFGGTCFSLSFLLHSILTQTGFINYIVMADMGRRRNVHCALITDIRGTKYLVDPGYLLTQSMELSKDKTRLYRSPQSGVEIKFDRQVESFQLYTFDQQLIKLRYTFQDRPTTMSELLQHWGASFYQGTMHGICLTQLRTDGMIYVHDNYLQIATIAGKKKRRIKDHYPEMIGEIFAIDPRWVEAAQAAIEENKQMEQQFGLYVPSAQ
jgi:arylamine N-acetyltransferase